MFISFLIFCNRYHGMNFWEIFGPEGPFGVNCAPLLLLLLLLSRLLLLLSYWHFNNNISSPNSDQPHPNH
jgi:hypothetical protein